MTRITITGVEWTPIPPDFVCESMAAVDRTILLGGGGREGADGGDVPPTVLELTIEDGGAVLGGPWSFPGPLPEVANMKRTPWQDAGPALVSAKRVGGLPLATVMFRHSADFPGCIGGWLRTLGTDRWEFIGSASPEADIDVSERIGIGEGLLAAGEMSAAEFFVVERASASADVVWPHGERTRSHWRPRFVPLPEGVSLIDGPETIHVSPSGRWVAFRGMQSERLRDGVMVYERGPAGLSLVERLDYPGYRVVDLAVTDEWLVIVERLHNAYTLRWRRAVTGEDRFLELGDVETTLDVLGNQALLTQGRRALLVDLDRGCLTHQVTDSQQTFDRRGVLVPGFAVFSTEGHVGVALL